MSNIIEMIPLVGIKMEKKSINLLDSREKVKLVLGRPYGVHKNSYYYFNNELRIDFNKQGLVEFIEILSGVDGKIQPKIYACTTPLPTARPPTRASPRGWTGW